MRHTQQQAIKEILKNLSITELNEMQSAVIDKAADSKHLRLLSPTGTGQTLA
jgi:Lhr-like helicase